MNIPKELAYNFIEYLDLIYLDRSPCSGNSDDYIYSHRDRMENWFSVSWSKGGTHGSCWDTKGPRRVKADPEPRMEELEEFLSKYYPHLESDDLEYIMDCVEENETSDSDYYGGRTKQGYKNLNFYQLAESLIKRVYNQSDEEYINFNDLLEQHSDIVIHMTIDEYPKLKLNRELNISLTDNTTENSRFKI